MPAYAVDEYYEPEYCDQGAYYGDLDPTESHQQGAYLGQPEEDLTAEGEQDQQQQDAFYAGQAGGDDHVDTKEGEPENTSDLFAGLASVNNATA